MTDRLGAGTEVCSRENDCPVVNLATIPDTVLDPAKWMNDALLQLQKNQITGLQVGVWVKVGERVHAVQGGLCTHV